MIHYLRDRGKIMLDGLAIFGSGSLLAAINKGTATVPFLDEYPGPDSNRHGLYSQRILSP